MDDGTLDDAKGRVKQAAGDITDDDSLKNEGRVDRASGAVKDKVGDAADKVKDVVNPDDDCTRFASPAGAASGRPELAGPQAKRELDPAVAAVQRQLQAHLGQPGDGALGDLRAQLVVVEVRRDHHRSAVLVAGVDDGVQLLEHPVGRALGADVVDVQQVDRGRAGRAGRRASDRRGASPGSR